MPGGIFDPIVANRFFIDLGSNGVATVSEVSGLEDETDVVETNQVGAKGVPFIVKSQGAMPLKTGKLTVKYAATKDDPIKKWYDVVVNQKVQDARTNITIKLFELAETAATLEFNFKNAWPSKFSYSSLTAKGNDPVSVTVTIEHEGMDVKGYNA